jgi:virginiamycin B lyase
MNEFRSTLLPQRRGTMFPTSVQTHPARQSRPYLERLEERCLLTINEFSTPTPNSSPVIITAGPDGNVWCTENAANKIGQITSTGSITEFPILPVSSHANPWGITEGPDGNLWFAESGANKIGRIMPDGTYSITVTSS